MTLESEVPSQAAAANEQLVLYRWWKDRLNRLDPWVESGLNAVFSMHDRKYGSGWILSEKSQITPAERLLYNEAHEKQQRLEEFYEQEDEAMMHRLINIRRSLWT